uniref:SMC5-SMC6 complex localization factor 1 n=1 Tax=Erpetoichthys calabaricus TaxID=27687 RepID=A0A8C4S5K5_ERPCA
MTETKKNYIFQISGIRDKKIKKIVLVGIKKLGGKYIGGSSYSELATHLIVEHPCASEKCLAFCAAGKWILPIKYLTESDRNGKWLPEESYEWNNESGKSYSSYAQCMKNAPKIWRMRMSASGFHGAFHDWKVVLVIANSKRKKTFERVLKAGNATVFSQVSAFYEITHVLTTNLEHCEDYATSLNVPCYSVSYIGEYLFGEQDENVSCIEHSYEESSRSLCSSFDNICKKEEFSDLENKLKSELTSQKSLICNYMPVHCEYYTSMVPEIQCKPSSFTLSYFQRIDYLISDLLFIEALEEVQNTLELGGIPPVHVLHSLMSHALQDDATVGFLNMFTHTLHEFLHQFSPLSSTSQVQFFLDFLQCPICKNGTWSFLENIARFCISKHSFCHPLPSPASSHLLKFQRSLLIFFIRLFESDLRGLKSKTTTIMVHSVVESIFWSNLDNSSSPFSKPIEDFGKLIIFVHDGVSNSKEADKMEVIYNVQEIFSMTVMYWLQSNHKLSHQQSMRKLKELADYLVLLFEDLPYEDSEKLISLLQSPWLKMFCADAMYRKLCSQNGIVLTKEPISLYKIVYTYALALGKLGSVGTKQAGRPQGNRNGKQLCTVPDTPAFTYSGDRQYPASGMPDLLAVKNQELSRTKCLSEQKKIPRGLHRVTMTGETVLHKICKRNQSEVLVNVLSVPGTDINAKDNAGWTPLHEACNHGSTDCVHIMLQLCPELDLLSVVEGVTPLHDALNNGHIDIAKMLLRHGGAVLLEQMDKNGKTPLDYVQKPTAEELLAIVKEPSQSEKPVNTFLIEMGCSLLNSLMTSYLEVYHLLVDRTISSQDSVIYQLKDLVATHTFESITSSWNDPEMIQYAKDLETLLKISILPAILPVVKACSGVHSIAFVLLLEFLSCH